MYRDLLAQARSLAKADIRKPRQANLRRATSAAYYALFHYLVDHACRNVMGSKQAHTSFRHVFARAFTHTDMKLACESFSGGTLKRSVRKGLPPGFSVPPQIIQISRTFVTLQSRRNTAEYDFTARFSRSEVLADFRNRNLLRLFYQQRQDHFPIPFYSICTVFQSDDKQ
jgi:hypothetical protein